MIDAKKTVFLPLDERVTELYVGYVHDGQLMKDIDEVDMYTEIVHYDSDYSYSIYQKVIIVTILIPFLFLFVFILLLALPFKKFDVVCDSIVRYNAIIWPFLFNKKKKKRIEKKRLAQYEHFEREDVPEFLKHCKGLQVPVYLYSYVVPSPQEQFKIDALINNKLIFSFHLINRLSDLSSLLKEDTISLHNSLLLIKSPDEQVEANLLGFNTEDRYLRNVALLKKRKFKSEGGQNELEWNSSDVIIHFKMSIDYYLRSIRNKYLQSNTIVFIDDTSDVFLSKYLQDNLDAINEKLELKGFKLIHFYSNSFSELFDSEGVSASLRYRFPFLYSIPDIKLDALISDLFKYTSAEQFCKLILEELQLPHFKRPALLRSISDGYVNTANIFTYKTIEYTSKEDLDRFFDWYINQVKIPHANIAFKMSDIPYENDTNPDISSKKRRFDIQYSLSGKPEEYDADNVFRIESTTLSEELKLKIDEIQKRGNVGVLTEVLLYMLEKLKEGNPDLLKNIQPLLDSKESVKKNAQLSHLSIDENYKIVLTDFGNIEIKMHALPKAVFILFLRYPDGIRFKELYMYKKELHEIYNKLTNKSDKNVIDRAIEDLVDMTNPSINQKCARIREAFRNYLDEDIARFYFISGDNGEPKKIKLPRHLMTIHFK